VNGSQPTTDSHADFVSVVRACGLFFEFWNTESKYKTSEYRIAMTVALILGTIFLAGSHAKMYNIEAYGAEADKIDDATMFKNGAVFNTTLPQLMPGDTLLIPNKTFHLYGGIRASGLRNVTIRLDGILRYANNRKLWPRGADDKTLACMHFDNIEDVTFTSSTQGLLDGNGAEWWGAIKYLLYSEDRPRMLEIYNSSGIIIEYLKFIQPPYWVTFLRDVDGVIIRYSEVAVHRGDSWTHNVDELQAFNTDGFDVAGRNVHMHDLQIWNDDDCVTLKGMGNGGDRARCSENWLIERVNASGLGFTIGSLGATSNTSCVRNITIKDSTMINTVKGIYLKTRWSDDPNVSGVIENIMFQNITMESPEQWAIWIGPAQQTDSNNACSLLWPTVPTALCPVPYQFDWRNITFLDITINNPKESPGVILGSSTNPMQNIVFDNVVVNNPSMKPWKDYYACVGVEGTAVNGTSPIPPCFNGGALCISDDKCQTSESMTIGMGCCSGKSHSTAKCGIYSRCGCVPSGQCPLIESDCCSSKSHSTLNCPSLQRCN